VDELARQVAQVESLGYRLVPFDPALLAAADDRTGRALLRALAVAGFAAGNVMLLSIGTWAGLTQGMGAATRALLHWVSALIALPAVAYAGMPFFRSAFAALRAGRTNMDVPISIGVVLVSGMSLAEAMRGGLHTYFDSAAMLLFFLLAGRVLDHRARGTARAAAERLLTLRTADVALLRPDGTAARMAPERVVAGTINLGEPLVVRAAATGGATLLAECVRLIEAAQAVRGRFVMLADRVARRYAPAVHATAAATFLLWWLGFGAPLEASLLTAASVLIITCPCALALAVPAVQVIATARLFRAGILLKSPTALERLAEVDTIVFDKTGTLTRPGLAMAGNPDPAALLLAAALGATSRHPLVRALAAEAGPVAPLEGAVEVPGQGVRCAGRGGELRLGSSGFCGIEAPVADTPELWLITPDAPPVCFRFDERLRPGAAACVAVLRRRGLRLLLASGDRSAPVARVARALGVAEVHAAQTPVAKAALLTRLKAEGRRVLMVGDGLNDAPALAAAHVSASPVSAADVSQTVADVVFQGGRLDPVAEILTTARRARAVMRENLALSLGYNMLALPLAVAGWVTPWLAAAAMSGSSLLVIANSFRLRGNRGP
jgi:Cu2+-exporting ATPase